MPKIIPLVTQYLPLSTIEELSKIKQHSIHYHAFHRKAKDDELFKLEKKIFGRKYNELFAMSFIGAPHLNKVDKKYFRQIMENASFSINDKSIQNFIDLYEAGSTIINNIEIEKNLSDKNAKKINDILKKYSKNVELLFHDKTNVDTVIKDLENLKKLQIKYFDDNHDCLEAILKMKNLKNLTLDNAKMSLEDLRKICNSNVIKELIINKVKGIDNYQELEHIVKKANFTYIYIEMPNGKKIIRDKPEVTNNLKNDTEKCFNVDNIKFDTTENSCLTKKEAEYETTGKGNEKGNKEDIGRG